MTPPKSQNWPRNRSGADGNLFIEKVFGPQRPKADISRRALCLAMGEAEVPFMPPDQKADPVLQGLEKTESIARSRFELLKVTIGDASVLEAAEAIMDDAVLATRAHRAFKL